MTGKDTATVLIPIDQIREIKLINKGGSAGVSFVLYVIVPISGLFIITIGVALIAYTT
jgi:hypothetical protein